MQNSRHPQSFRFTLSDGFHVVLSNQFPRKVTMISTISVLSALFCSQSMAMDVDVASSYRPKNGPVKPGLFNPVIKVCCDATEIDQVKISAAMDTICPKTTYIYHEMGNSGFDAMVNSFRGIRAAAKSVGHVIITITTPRDLIDVLQQDGRGHCLIFGGGHAPSFGKALGLNVDGAVAAVSGAIREAVDIRGWTFIGDCCGFMVAGSGYKDYKSRNHFGLNLVPELFAKPALHPRSPNRNKMSTVQVDFRTHDNVLRSVDVLFCDGPEFSPSSLLSYNVLAWYSYSSSHPELNKGDPALISLKKGNGRIILSTVHFESVFLRGYDLVFDYIRIMKENPNCSPNEWFDMMLEHYEDTCSVETSPENGCVITTPRNLASSWMIIGLIINEIEKKDIYSALAP